MKKIIGFWILGMVIIVGIFFFGREFYYYKNPDIIFGIGRPTNPNADKYMEHCIIHGMRRSVFGMDKKIAEKQLLAHEVISELTFRVTEKEVEAKKANLKLEFSFENNRTTVTYRGMIEDEEGNQIPVVESASFDGILTTKVNDGTKNYGMKKWHMYLYNGGVVVCGVLWLGALILIFRKKR